MIEVTASLTVLAASFTVLAAPFIVLAAPFIAVVAAPFMALTALLAIRCGAPARRERDALERRRDGLRAAALRRASVAAPRARRRPPLTFAETRRRALERPAFFFDLLREEEDLFLAITIDLL